jgi:hypothetical protein
MDEAMSKTNAEQRMDLAMESAKHYLELAKNDGPLSPAESDLAASIGWLIRYLESSAETKATTGQET